MPAVVPAFTYRARRDDQAPVAVSRGATVTLREHVKYLLRFEDPPSASDRQRLLDLGGEFLSDDLAILSIGNFVGTTSLAGVVIEVVSPKIGPEGVSRLLVDVSALSSSLVFGWRSPTGFAAVPDPARLSPVPYHQLHLLHSAMLSQPAGRRLQDWLRVIERNPTRRFEPHRTLTPVGRVRRLDHRAVQSVFSRVERLASLAPGVRVGDSPLAERLTFGAPPRPHFPLQVDAPSGQLSFDTPENRFIRHAIIQCLELIHRFIDHPKLHTGLKADCRTMLVLLEPVASARFVAESGPLWSLRAPSQALTKADGYREVFQFWNELNCHVSLPRTNRETARLLDGRDVATLYEYWAFLKILEAAVEITEGALAEPPAIRRDELGERLRLGITSTVGPDLEIGFNPSFSRSSGTAYTTLLRPDVTLRADDRLHAFDAKFRLDRFNVDERDSDDGRAGYKRADLYKMHTYRDAISGLRTAFVVYPGSEFVFFERGGNLRARPADVISPDGVGALPLRPADEDPAASLRGLLRALIIPR